MNKPTEFDEKKRAAMDAGVHYGLRVLREIPKDDAVTLEAHMTGVLIAFWGALWGTFGTEYARGFIEAQLRGMESDGTSERYEEPPFQ